MERIGCQTLVGVRLLIGGCGDHCSGPGHQFRGEGERSQKPPGLALLAKRNQGVGQTCGRGTGSQGHRTLLWSGPLCQHLLPGLIPLNNLLAVLSFPSGRGGRQRHNEDRS